MRPPIKEQLGLAIGYGGAGGYYVEPSLDGLLVAAGLHHPASDQLGRYRAAIDDGRRAASFERALATARAAGLEPAPPELAALRAAIRWTTRKSSGCGRRRSRSTAATFLRAVAAHAGRRAAASAPSWRPRARW